MSVGYRQAVVRAQPMSRRHVLRGGALAVTIAASGCTGEDGKAPAPDDPSPPTETAPDDPDVALLTKAIRDETALLAFCERLRRRQPQLARVIAPISVRQRAHVRRLSASLTERPERDPAGHPTVPPQRKAALGEFREQLSAAEQARLEDCLGATSGLLARLLASVSASHAATLEAVRELR